MNDVIIEATGISKVYWDGTRSLQVLKGISFTAKRGESVAVWGPSGSGKTTLLNVLSGLDRPSEGTVRLEGQELQRLSDKDQARFRNEKIGFVFQFYHLLPEFTAIENVMLPAMLSRKGSRAEQANKASALLARVGLKERGSHYPSELSGGEQQRVAIARALMNEPAMLFCDEPTGNLDAAAASGIVSLLKELSARENKTVVIVTHDAKVAKIASRIWEMEKNES